MIVLCLPLILSVGISPAITSVDFKPGMELEYDYLIFASPDQKVDIYAKGEFADLVRFDKTEIVGSGSVNVKIKLPNAIERPGEHVLLIGAIERVEVEGVVGVVGTRIAIQSPIKIQVPYPGKYAEISFKAYNANLGEDVKLELEVASKGYEPIVSVANIDIYSGENKLENIKLGTKSIQNQETEIFIGYLNTEKYNPGDYNAVAIVNYEENIAIANDSFRIGHLFVNLTNHTRNIIKGGIKPFEIEVESSWNDILDNVYAKVLVQRKDTKSVSFLTPSVSLKNWEKRILLGYLDTDEFDFGTYTIIITINYEDIFSNTKETTEVYKKLKIVREIDYTLCYIIGGIIIGVVLIIMLIIIFLFKKKKNINKRKNVSKKKL